MKGEDKMAETYKDPVCDMDVTEETAAGKSEYQGKTYYFCSPGCKRSFDKDPEKYLSEKGERIWFLAFTIVLYLVFS
jgi:YHS domain-containing protein